MLEKEKLIQGGQYKVNAVGTKTTEVWTISKITEKDNGVVEYECKTPTVGHVRTFLQENFVSMEQRFGKKIISESVELVGVVDGYELWVEHVTHWPPQKKRGRKKKVEAEA